MWRARTLSSGSCRAGKAMPNPIECSGGPPSRYVYTNDGERLAVDPAMRRVLHPLKASLNVTLKEWPDDSIDTISSYDRGRNKRQTLGKTKIYASSIATICEKLKNGATINLKGCDAGCDKRYLCSLAKACQKKGKNLRVCGYPGTVSYSGKAACDKPPNCVTPDDCP